MYIFGLGDVGEKNAQGGQAYLAQARQNRPGIGELDLTELWAILVVAHCARMNRALTDDSSKRSGYRDRPY